MATILLTGAGGAAIPTLITHLRSIGHRVLAADCDKHAAGLYLADAGFVIPRGDSPNWSSAVDILCRNSGVDILVPLVDEELPKAARIQRGGLQALVPGWEFVDLCLHKDALMASLQQVGIPPPRTRSANVLGLEGLRFPLVLKPKTGHGSRNVCVLRTMHDVMEQEAKWNRDGFSYMLQEYIPGTEYTVSVVCDQRNTVHAVVPKRIIDKHGITRLAVTEHNEVIGTLCRDIAAKLHPRGPFNVQLRLGKDGQPYVFEINPRFSGTVNLTIQAGCDEVGGLIAEAMGEPYQWGEWREGVVLVRQYADAVVEEVEFGRKRVEEI